MRGETRPSRVPAQGNVVKLEPTTDAPAPERPLGTAGAQLWEAVWRDAWAWMALSDAHVLLQACELLDERVSLRLEVLRRQRDKQDVWRERLSLRSLDQQFLASLIELGLTPAARSRLGVAEVQRVSKLDALRRTATKAKQ